MTQVINSISDVENVEKETEEKNIWEIQDVKDKVWEIVDYDNTILEEIDDMIKDKRIDDLIPKLKDYDLKYHRIVAMKLIQSWEWDSVVLNIKEFEWLNHKEIVLRLIGGWNCSCTLNSLEKFEWLDRDVAMQLIDYRYWDSVVLNIKEFEWLDHREIALKLIEKWFWWFTVIKNLEKFEWLDHREVALKLIEKWDWESVIKNLEKFEWLNHREIVLKLIEKWHSAHFLEILEKFEWLNHREIVLKLIEKWNWYIVANYLNKFEWLDKEVALKLIEEWKWYNVAQYLNKFEWLDKEIAMKLIDSWKPLTVLKNIQKFQWLTYKEILIQSIENLERSLIFDNQEEFKWLDLGSVISESIDDVEVKSWYDLLLNSIWSKQVLRYMREKQRNYVNIHDSLLFMQKIEELEKNKQELFIKTVLKPLFHQITDFEEFNNLIWYFDVDVFLSKYTDRQFKNYEEFKREALIQKNNVIIPEWASDSFKNAINIMIDAPWVDVWFIKYLVNKYVESNNLSLKNEKNIYEITSHKYNYVDDDFDDLDEKSKNITLKRNEKFDSIFWKLDFSKSLEYTEKNKIFFTVLEKVKKVNILTADDDYYNLLEIDHNWYQYVIPVHIFLEILWKNYGDDYYEVLKNLNISIWEKREYYNSNSLDSEFSEKLLNIIEWKDKIDERQIIKPFLKTLPFDPLNKLLSWALWINSINNETPKYQKLFKQDENIKQIFNNIWIYNDKLRKNIIDKFDLYIKEDTKNKEKYIIEREKEIKEDSILEYGDWKKVKNLNYSNLNNLDESEKDELIKDFKLFLDENKISILESISILYENIDSIKENNEISDFTELWEIYKDIDSSLNISDEINIIKQKNDIDNKEKNSLIATIKQEKFWNIEKKELEKIFDWKELLLFSYLSYVWINNLKRQSNSKPMNRELSQIFDQKKYVDMNNDLKEKGIITDNSRPLKSYIDWSIDLDDQDIESVKNVLWKYGYDMLWRQLKVEIAKKSDPRWWVCWDYTNCCMPLTSEKNKEYLLREDMAYFLISIVDQDWNEDLVAQSVLIWAWNDKNFDTLVIDNIEVANKAIKYMDVLWKGYELLKEKYKDKKIIIWTSYNDDWWVVTWSCEMEKIVVKPLNWEIVTYSDCFRHDEAYMYNNPLIQKDNWKIKYYWLQRYNIDKSHVRFMISKEEFENVKDILTKIWKWEDDWDGWLIFPDNYSVVLWWEKDYKWHILAADYISDDYEENSLIVEKINFKEWLKYEEKEKLLKDYFDRKDLKWNNNFSEIIFKSHEDDIVKIIIAYFKNFEIENENWKIFIKK